jgi:hypothetical protein
MRFNNRTKLRNFQAVKMIFLLLLLLAAISCRPHHKVPDGLYTKQEVAAFLMDLYLLEAKIHELRLTNDSAKKVFAISEARLFEQHQLDDSLYRASFAYYLNDPKALNDLYTLLTDSLSLRERIQLGESVGGDHQ